MRDDHVLHAFTLTVFLINLSQKYRIYCQDLQMTGSKCLKLGILALQYINRMPIKNTEYLIIG